MKVRHYRDPAEFAKATGVPLNVVQNCLLPGGWEYYHGDQVYVLKVPRDLSDHRLLEATEPVG